MVKEYYEDQQPNRELARGANIKYATKISGLSASWRWRNFPFSIAQLEYKQLAPSMQY
jgi:hypothetical protein